MNKPSHDSRQGIKAPDIVDMSGVSFAWPGQRAFAVQVDAFKLPEGSRTLLIGPSGSGKSTVLSLLCGIVSPQQGNITLLGTNIATLSSAARDRFRAEHIGVIFQMFNLLPYGSVVDNVLLPLSFAAQRRARAQHGGPPAVEARRLLRALDIDAGLFDGPAGALSVGQQQRVAVARALIGSPELIIADEPTSALDGERQTRFLDLLFDQLDAAGSTLLMVSHDERLGARFDQVLDLRDIVRVGSAT